MTNDGVFLDPDTGDLIATGQISAAQVSLPTENDIMVNGTPFMEFVNTSISATVSTMVSAMIENALTAQYGNILDEQF